MERGDCRKRLDVYYQRPEFRVNRTRAENVPHVIFDELITYIGNGETPRGAQYPETGIPFLRVQNIIDDHLDLTEIVYITESQHRQMRRSQIKPRNLLMAISGATIGKCAVVPEDIGACNTNQHLARIVLRGGVNERYIHAYIVSVSGQLQVKRNISGGTQGYINYNRIRSFLIPYPSLDTQDAIADKMDAAYRRKRELEAEAEALLESIDGYVLGELGTEWGKPPDQGKPVGHEAVWFGTWRRDVKRLDPKRYRHQREGAPPKGLRRLGDLLTRRQEKVDRSKYAFEDLQLISLHFDGTMSARDVKAWRKDIKGTLWFAYPGDLVYSKIDARNGAIGLVPHELGRVAVTSEYPVYRVKEGISAEYLKIVLRTLQFTDLLKVMAAGHSGRKRVQPGELEDVLVPVPLLDRQRKIVAEVQTRREQARALKEEAEQVVAEAKAEVERMILGEE